MSSPLPKTTRSVVASRPNFPPQVIRAAVIAKLGSGRQVSEVFARLLRRTARPFAAGSNADGMGAGIVDATALLAADLASAQSMDESIELESISAIAEPAAGTRAAFEKALAELEG